METKSLNNELIVRFLLGDLPKEEQEWLEERAFSDRKYMQNILAVESDLIDEYVRGELSSSNRIRFERLFLLSPERQRKVEFARALENLIPASRAEEAVQPEIVFPKNSWWNSFMASIRGLNPAFKLSMAAVTVTLMIFASWLITETVRLRGQVAQLQTEGQASQRQAEILRRQADGQRARNEEMASMLERERQDRNEKLSNKIERDQLRAKSASSSIIAVLFLPPGISRSASDRQKLVVTPATRLVRLQIGLEREDEYQSFRVELRTAQGHEVWTQDQLLPGQSRAGRFINLFIPGNVFSTGEYELALKGVIDNQTTEDVRYYYFDTKKR